MNLFKKYKNLIFFFGGIFFAILLSKLSLVSNFLINLHHLGYLGALFGGILFVYSFTVGFGIVILTILAKNLPILPLALVAGIGSVLGDLFVFKLIKDNLKDELEDIYKIIDKKQVIKKILKIKYLKWFLPILGIFIIASPFPDELGIALVGISNVKKSHFMLASFLLNSMGIYLLISLIT